MQNLSKLLKRLLETEVDFILVGGFAGVVHGSTMVTQDLDVCIAIDEQQIAKLREALKDLRPRHRMNPTYKPSFLTHPESLESVKNLYLETDWGVLDVLSELPPLGGFHQIKSNAASIQIYNHLCKVISLDDLIRIKQSMTRPKDKQSLEELKRLKALKK